GGEAVPAHRVSPLGNSGLSTVLSAVVPQRMGTFRTRRRIQFLTGSFRSQDLPDVCSRKLPLAHNGSRLSRPRTDRDQERADGFEDADATRCSTGSDYDDVGAFAGSPAAGR